jgi:predicted nucleic acid-binding protein
MWLLDTMVISELRKRDPDSHVVAWLSTVPSNHLFLSVVTISELQRGIIQQRAKDVIFAEKLQLWLDDLVRNYADRILPITQEIATQWGNLSAQAGHDGPDVMIAATALHHGHTVATRNIRHFSHFPIKTQNPYS